MPMDPIAFELALCGFNGRDRFARCSKLPSNWKLLATFGACQPLRWIGKMRRRLARTALPTTQLPNGSMQKQLRAGKRSSTLHVMTGVKRRLP